jgi:hypothetical protein
MKNAGENYRQIFVLFQRNFHEKGPRLSDGGKEDFNEVRRKKRKNKRN